MVDYYAELVERFPIWSIEHGLAEDDWDGYIDLIDRVSGTAQLVGDDIFVTNPAHHPRASSRNVENAALIKVNKIGTVTETLEA